MARPRVSLTGGALGFPPLASARRRHAQGRLHRRINRTSSRITQPRGAFRDRIQHRLNIRRRAGNDAQDFTRRSLLLERFLEFLKQPNILDRDDGLVGEGFEQLDLRRGEGAHFDATCDQSFQ